MEKILSLLFPKAIASLQREAIAALKPQVVCEHCLALLEEGDPRLYTEYSLCDKCAEAYEAMQKEMEFYDNYEYGYSVDINETLL
jgi:hypothetical protein